MTRLEIEDELKAASAKRLEYMERLRLGGIAVLPLTERELRERLRAVNKTIAALYRQLGDLI